MTNARLPAATHCDRKGQRSMANIAAARITVAPTSPQGADRKIHTRSVNGQPRGTPQSDRLRPVLYAVSKAR